MPCCFLGKEGVEVSELVSKVAKQIRCPNQYESTSVKLGHKTGKNDLFGKISRVNLKFTNEDERSILSWCPKEDIIQILRYGA